MLRERHGIAELALAGLAYRGEVGRLVARHYDRADGDRADSGGANADRLTAYGPGGDWAEDEDVARLRDLIAGLEPVPAVGGPKDVEAWVGTLEVARFLAAEGR